MVTQLAPLDAVHGQPPMAFTVKSRAPPAAATVVAAGLISKLQGDGDCRIIARESFTASSPSRGEGAGFGATSSWICAGPCPEAGATVTQDACVDAVQEHSGWVDTTIVPVPPPGAI